MDQTRTIKQAISEAALLGFAARVTTHDGGQTIHVEQSMGFITEGKRIPPLRISYQWGEERSAVKAIDQHVAEHRRRREDDASVMHESISKDHNFS